MKEILKKSEKWAKKARKARLKLEDEAYEIATELIREFGEDKGNNIVINIEDSETSLYVMEYNGFDGDYIGRTITSIELSKEYGGISLIYGEDEYEYIKFSETLLSDRIYIVNTLISMFS